MSNDAISTVRMAAFLPSTNKASPNARNSQDMHVARPEQDEAAVTEQTVKVASQQIESYLRSVGRQIEFRLDEASGHMVVSVRDAETGELIRQIPGEEVLRMARVLKEGSPALIDLKV